MGSHMALLNKLLSHFKECKIKVSLKAGNFSFFVLNQAKRKAGQEEVNTRTNDLNTLLLSCSARSCGHILCIDVSALANSWLFNIFRITFLTS